MAMHERTEKKRSSEDFRTEVRETGPSPSSSQSPAGGITNNAGLAIAGYCCASILMTLTNKYVVSGTRFNLNFLLLAMQSIVCLGAIEVLKVFRVITFRNFNKEEAKLWFPISVLLVGMIYTGSKSLQFLSVPVYTIFKNLTIICIAYGEVLWFGASITPLTMVSFLLMVVSSIVAAWADISNSSAQAAAGTQSFVNVGYIWMMVNCFCSAAFVLIMRKRIKLTKFKDFDTMFYNNLLSIPVLFVATFTLEDWSGANLVRNFPPETRVSLFSAIIFSGLSTVAISYTSAWCIRVTSSTTYSMVGALNKLPIALSGLLFFGDAVTFFSVTAIFLGFLAGLVYAVAKSNQAKAVSTLPK